MAIDDSDWNIKDIDWNQSSMREILSALSNGLEAAAQQFHPGPLVDDALDYQDALCGIAFVTSQVYITEVVARRPDIKKPRLLTIANPLVAGIGLTQMQLCDTMANYYKHHEEWGDWTNSRYPTIELLRTAGVTRCTPHPCTHAATLLFGTTYVESLVPLVDMLSSWRAAVIAGATS